MGLSRSADTGVTSLSMSAGTGKIRVVSAARAGVPRATLSEAEKVRKLKYVWRAWLSQRQPHQICNIFNELQNNKFCRIGGQDKKW